MKIRQQITIEEITEEEWKKLRERAGLRTIFESAKIEKLIIRYGIITQPLIFQDFRFMLESLLSFEEGIKYLKYKRENQKPIELLSNSLDRIKSKKLHFSFGEIENEITTAKAVVFSPDRTKRNDTLIFIKGPDFRVYSISAWIQYVNLPFYNLKGFHNIREGHNIDRKIVIADYFFD